MLLSKKENNELAPLSYTELKTIIINPVPELIADHVQQIKTDNNEETPSVVFGLTRELAEITYSFF